MKNPIISDLPVVQNFTSSNSNDVPNQFLIKFKDKIVFQSYSSIIAVKVHSTGKIYLDANKWDYSKTTGRYRNEFLEMDKKQIVAAIKSGQIELIDLN